MELTTEVLELLVGEITKEDSARLDIHQQLVFPTHRNIKVKVCVRKTCPGHYLVTAA